MSDDFTIRLGTPADAEAIGLESMAEIEHGLAWRWEPWRISEAMAHPETNVVVAVDGDEMLGFAIMEYTNDVAHLVLFAVREKARRRGIGSALLAWLEKVASVAGITYFRVEARHSNIPAREFYRKHGYVELEVVPRMYEKTEDGVRLEKGVPAAEFPEPESADEARRLYEEVYPATYRELREEWATWSPEERRDFVNACSCLYGEADYPDMVRFVMKHGDPELRQHALKVLRLDPGII